MPLSREKTQNAVDHLIAAHKTACETNDWLFFVDDIYATDCIYTCEYAGVMEVIANGIDEIKATHYGRDMNYGWEGWSFPYINTYVTEGKGITHWMNRGPGKKPDGSYYETPGVSFLTFDHNSKICEQFDMFDLAYQMKLCDELEAAGLLSDALKENWVIPMKTKLIKQLSKNL